MSAKKLSCFVFLATCVMATTAYADSSYMPYYQQMPEDKYLYANVDLPANWNNPKGVTENVIVPPRALEQPEPSTLPLGTRQGFDGGLQISYYRYNEPSPQVLLDGTQIGGTAAMTLMFDHHMFDTVDFRYAYGRLNYSSPASGSSDDHENELWELRDLVGKDFVWNDHFALSPYMGVGFRDLYSDSRGVTTLGAAGYRRDSEYLYLPIGVRPQFRIDGADRVTTSVEYDYFAHGWQTSHLGDTGGGDPTVHNGQDRGFGIRADAMWETANWAFGPFINYWNINDSAGKIFYSPNATCTSNICVGTEPHSVTLEAGLQLKYHFVDF